MFILFFCANKRFQILAQLLILSDLFQIIFIVIVAHSIIQRGNFNFCSGLINTIISYRFLPFLCVLDTLSFFMIPIYTSKLETK